MKRRLLMLLATLGLGAGLGIYLQQEVNDSLPPIGSCIGGYCTMLGGAPGGRPLPDAVCRNLFSCLRDDTTCAGQGYTETLDALRKAQIDGRNILDSAVVVPVAGGCGLELRFPRPVARVIAEHLDTNRGVRWYGRLSQRPAWGRDGAGRRPHVWLGEQPDEEGVDPQDEPDTDAGP